MKRQFAVGRMPVKLGVLLLTLALMGFTTAVASAATVSGDGTLVGSTGNDNINAGNGMDTVWGLGGSDNITAGNGDDMIDGGGMCSQDLKSGDYPGGIPGTDYCEHGNNQDCGMDQITAGSGNDMIWGGCGPNDISAANGNGKIFANGGPNNVGTTGNGNYWIYAYGQGTYSVGKGSNMIFAQYSVGDNISCGNKLTTVYTAPGANTVSKSCTVVFVAQQSPPTGAAQTSRSAITTRATTARATTTSQHVSVHAAAN